MTGDLPPVKADEYKTFRAYATAYREQEHVTGRFNIDTTSLSNIFLSQPMVELDNSTYGSCTVANKNCKV